MDEAACRCRQPRPFNGGSWPWADCATSLDSDDGETDRYGAPGGSASLLKFRYRVASANENASDQFKVLIKDGGSWEEVYSHNLPRRDEGQTLNRYWYDWELVSVSNCQGFEIWEVGNQPGRGLAIDELFLE